MKPTMLLVSIAALAGLAACTDDPSPRATIKSATPDQLTPSDDALDDLTITLRYDDADGDLGGGVAEIHDCRAADVVTELAIPAIAGEAHQHITGELDLRVNDIGALATGALPAECAALGVDQVAPGTVVFCVVLADAAGHRGPGACTRPIALAGS